MKTSFAQFLWPLIAGLALNHTALASERKIPLLFVLYDAGETLALQPVMDELSKAGVSYKALVMGTARQVMKARSDNRDDTLDITKDCGTTATVDQQSWPRERALSTNDLEKIKECFDARIIVTGMVSEVQHQIALIQNKNSHKVIAFYDSLAKLEPKSINESFLTIASKILVPSQEILEQIKKISPNSDVIVAGQPTLEKWALAKEQLNPASIYAQLPFLKKNLKTLLYAGGYGDSYKPALTLFAQAAKRLSKFNVLLSLHPKVDGTLEKEALAKAGADNVVIIPKSISTMDAAIVSDVVVVQSSTVGVQALFMGKPVFYLNVPESSYKDVAISMGWAQQLFDANSFVKNIELAVDQKRNHPIDIYAKAGIPHQSAKLIGDLLQSELKQFTGGAERH